MSYSIKDILDKMIDMELHMSNIYTNISNLNGVDFADFKVLAKVMSKEEERHVVFLNKLKKMISAEWDIEIDYFTYDKISQLFYQFKSKISIPKVNNISELISFILNFEKENLSLLLDIKGRFIKTLDDDKSSVYKILSLLIDEETKHVKDIQTYSNGNIK